MWQPVLRILFLFALLGGGPLCATPPTEVGVAPAGGTACEYVGVVSQDDAKFIVFGYLTKVRGLDDRVLFTDAEDRNEKTARFTFYSESKMTGRSLLGNLFVVQAAGTLTIYSRPDGNAAADFEKPSFADFRGTPVAFFKTEGQSTVIVTQPQRGLNMANFTVKQVAANPFETAGGPYQFGGEGREYRFSHSGAGEREPGEPVKATLWIAGHAIAVGP